MSFIVKLLVTKVQVIAKCYISFYEFIDHCYSFSKKIFLVIFPDKTNKESSDPEKTPDVPKELPQNPKPPGHMKIMPPQVSYCHKSCHS